MRNLTIVAALLVLALGNLHAQITTYRDTLPDGTITVMVDSGQPPIEVIIDSIFGGLNFAQVSTGLLMDRTIHLVDYTRYDGTVTDSNKLDYRTFLSLYGSVYSAPLDTSNRPLPDLPAYKATAAAIAANGIVPVGALLMRYHRIKPTALTDNLLSLNGIQLQDVPGRPSSPYQEGRIFAVAPMQARFEQAGLTFQFPASLYQSNSGLTLTSIEFDAGTGLGFQPVGPGGSYAVTYPDSGTYMLQFRYHYSNGSSYTCRGEIEVMAGPAYRYGDVADDEIPIPPAAAHGGATLSISYGCGHTALTKPFIIVEGLNPNIEIGENIADYGRFIDNIDEVNLSLKSLLEEEGYDLIYVDYENGGDDIKRNARLLEDVLKWVNTAKASQPDAEPNVVLGLSMGGLVSRWCLRTMEVESKTHDVRLFITHDSPHQGAYIPLGLLYTFTHLYHMRRPFGGAYLRDERPEISKAYGAIYAPATQQMLVHFPQQNVGASNRWANNPNRTIKTTFTGDSRLKSTPFLQDLDNLGHPQQCRIVAIANGSGEGQELEPGFGPNDPINLITAGQISGSFPALGAIANISTQTWGLPDQTMELSTIYNGVFDVLVGVGGALAFNRVSRIRVEVENTDPYETAPGSVFDPADLGDNTEGLGTLFQDRWHFVPVTSALDITSPDNENLFFAVNQNNILNLTNPKTPFKSYSAPSKFHATASLPEVNELHTQFTLSNEPFLIAEMIGPTLNTPSVVNGSGDLVSTFNFGKNATTQTSNQINTDVRVAGGKILGIQRAADLGISGSGLGQPQAGSHFSVTVSAHDCEGTPPVVVTVDNGELQIGTSGGGTTGELIFTGSGIYTSKLALNANSTLRIHNNSRLVIEPGATLRIENGSHIELLGDNAVLEIRGKLELGPYASLTFTGSGFIRLGIPVQGTTNVQLIGAGPHRLELHGSGPTDKVLEIMDYTAWYPSYNIGLTILTDGKIEMGKDAWLDTGNGQVVFSNVHFTAKTPNISQRYLTVYTNGQTNQLIQNAEFSWGQKGLSSRNTLSNGASPTISTSKFHDCATGLYSVGKGMTLNQVEIYNNTTGWQASSQTFGCSFVNSKANNNGAGIFFTGNVGLTLTTSEIDNNGSGLYYAGTGSVTGNCSKIRNNSSYGVLVSSNGSPNFSGQSKMNISGNPYSISLSQASNIYLNDGRNYLVPSSGASNRAVTGTLSGSLTSVTATRNQWNTRIPAGNPIPNPGKPPVSGIDYSLTNGSGASVTVSDNLPYAFLDCGGGGSAQRIVQQTATCTNCPSVQTAHIPGLRLDLAINEAFEQMADTTDAAIRAAGLEKLGEILTYDFPFGVNNARLRSLLDRAYLELKEYVANGIASGTLASDSSSHTPQLTGVPALLRMAINKRRLQHQAAGDSVRSFYLATDRALAYDWVGRTGRAIQLLQNLQSANRSVEEQVYLDHWICHLDLKKQYQLGLVTSQQWDSLTALCPSPDFAPILTGASARFSASFDVSEPELSVFPNPASDALHIRYVPVGEPSESVRIQATLLSVTGVYAGEILPSQGVFSGLNEWEVSTAHIAPGMYLLRVDTGAGGQMFKIAIVR